MNEPFEPSDKAPEPLPGAEPVPTVSPAPVPRSNGSAVAPRRVVRTAPGMARRPAVKSGAHNRPAGGRSRPARTPRPAQPSHSTRPVPSGGAAHGPHAPHHYDKLVDEGDDGFFARHRAKIIVAVIALLASGAAYFVKNSKPSGPVSKAPEIVKISLPPMVRPPPPPPPPPPKTVQPPKPDEKMVTETQPDEKHEDPKPQAPEPAALGTNLKGDGEGLAGLGGTGNGGGFGGGHGGGGSKWGWYAGQVQSRVAEALKRNGKTKSANMRIQVRIWPDPSTGRILRAKLDGTTGDSKLDAAIQNEVLTGLQLQEAPPPGMPSPIVLRLTARRP